MLAVKDSSPELLAVSTLALFITENNVIVKYPFSGYFKSASATTFQMFRIYMDLK